MFIKKYDKRPASHNAVASVIDIKRKNAKNCGKYSNASQRLADQVYLQASDAYIRSRIFRNYRDHVISIKVENVNGTDKISGQVTSLNKFCEQNNIELVAVGNHLIYHIPQI